MPRKGYVSITVTEKLAKKLGKIAKKEESSIPRAIEEMANKKLCISEA